MATTEKITEKQKYEMIIKGLKGEPVDTQMLTEFCDHKIEQLAKKTTKKKEPTAADLELDKTILEILAKFSAPVAVKEIREKGGMTESSSKIQARLKGLAASDKVAITDDKKGKLYAVK